MTYHIRRNFHQFHLLLIGENFIALIFCPVLKIVYGSSLGTRLLFWVTNQISVLLTLGTCARVTVVILCICVSVTTLTATYLVCESKVQFYKVPYSVPNACIVYISLKMLCSPALASFADPKLLDFQHSTFYLCVKSCTNGAYTVGLCMYLTIGAHARGFLYGRGLRQMSPELFNKAFSTKSTQCLPWNAIESLTAPSFQRINQVCSS